MAVNWHNLAIATSCLLEYERVCERRTFIDEASLVRASAEFIQSSTQLMLVPEHNHANLDGNQRLDLLGRTRLGVPASFVAEAKWVRARGGTRQWVTEVTNDILRLERLQDEMAVSTDRAIIVGGIGRSIQSKFIDANVRAGNGNPRVRALPHILQERDDENSVFPYAQKRVSVRECDASIRQFWQARATHFGGCLPISYQCTLAGWHRAGPHQDSVEVYVWLIRRSRNRSEFSFTNDEPAV